ncbi:MAG TPA: hypothetical protein P5531_13430 [Bacteroidales bacterium]|nr:hypothetical protein [Bacteroidales bacterium]HSA44591.1 hypothetical protein [Bacteroidales bacterium]
MKRFFPLVLLCLLFLMHLPFLTSDPDRITDVHTRGAWTDEGLYSAQLRNYLISGEFDIKENSTFVRGPLLNMLQFPFFYLFGNQRIVARLIVLLITFAVPLLFLRLKGFEAFAFFSILLIYSQLHLFHFSHYALAEMLAIDMVLVSVYFFIRSQSEKALSSHRAWYILLATCFIFIAYGLKIQFLYLAALLPFSLLVVAFTVSRERGQAFHLFGLSVLFALLLAGLYAVWYAINKSFYDYIMLEETGGRFASDPGQLIETIRWNFNFFLWVRELKPLWIALPVSLMVIIWQRFRRKTGRQSLAMWVIGCCWLILELHKLPMWYLPNRYLLPLFAVVSLLAAFALSLLYLQRGIYKWSALMAGILIAVLNVPFHYRIYEERSDGLGEMNHYLASVKYDGRYGLGSWAASASWGSDMRTAPVWKDYFNAKDPLQQFHPAVIITETDQSDSNQAWMQLGIDPGEYSDSARIFRIWKYDVGVYWLKQGLATP